MGLNGVVISDVPDEKMMLRIDGDVFPVVQQNARHMEFGDELAVALDAIEDLLLEAAAIVMCPKNARILPAGNDAGTLRDVRVGNPSNLQHPGSDLLCLAVGDRHGGFSLASARRQPAHGEQEKVLLARIHFGDFLDY